MGKAVFSAVIFLDRTYAAHGFLPGRYCCLSRYMIRQIEFENEEDAFWKTKSLSVNNQRWTRSNLRQTIIAQAKCNNAR